MRHSSLLVEERVEAIRSFNRFYAQKMGVFSTQDASPFSLTEVRILFELFTQQRVTAKDICRALAVDPGYVSRILHRFEEKKLIIKKADKRDARQRFVGLTVKGRRLYLAWADHANRHVRNLLETLCDDDQVRVVSAMQVIEELLSKTDDESFVVRILSPKWLNGRFSGYSLEDCEKLAADMDMNCEKHWIADRNGRLLCAALFSRVSETTGEVRLVSGELDTMAGDAGQKLLRKAVSFSRHAGYSKLIFNSKSRLNNVEALLQEAGFEMVERVQYAPKEASLPACHWEIKI